LAPSYAPIGPPVTPPTTAHTAAEIMGSLFFATLTTVLFIFFKKPNKRILFLVLFYASIVVSVSGSLGLVRFVTCEVTTGALFP
jgi:energy-converting hydrogenase Eha subunit G